VSAFLADGDFVPRLPALPLRADATADPSFGRLVAISGHPKHSVTTSVALKDHCSPLYCEPKHQRLECDQNEDNWEEPAAPDIDLTRPGEPVRLGKVRRGYDLD